MAEWLRPVSQKVTTRVQVRSRTIFFPAPARICIAACFASASLLCIAASASKSMQIAMQMAAMQIAASSASLLLHRNRCRSRCSLSPPGLHRFCIASASQNLLKPQASLTLGLMQIAMQMAKTDAEFCIAHLHRICIKICIGSRASVVLECELHVVGGACVRPKWSDSDH